MSDSDPFSGMPLSPPSADIKTDNLSLADALSLALSDTNNISQPALRALANFIATKISALTNSQIARLSDDKIARLIDTELSRLSDDEIKHLINSHVSGFCSSIGGAISSFFASVVGRMIEELTPSFVKQNPETAFQIFQGFLCIGFGILFFKINYKIEKWFEQRARSADIKKHLSRLPPPRRYLLVSTKVQPRHSRRPSFGPSSLYQEQKLLRSPFFGPYILHPEEPQRHPRRPSIESSSLDQEEQQRHSLRSRLELYNLVALDLEEPRIHSSSPSLQPYSPDWEEQARLSSRPSLVSYSPDLELERPRLSRRPSFGPYSRNVEGLKYIAEQHQEGISRVVPIRRLTGIGATYSYLVRRSLLGS